VISGQTVKGAVHAARRVLRSLPDGTCQIVTSFRGISQVRAIHGAVTDLALLRSRYQEAVALPPSPEAIGVLVAGLRLVDGPPFDGPGFDWAYQAGMDIVDAELLVERAATRLVDLALDLGHIDLAREAVAWGLRGVPGNEVLGRRGMWAERCAGNTPGVHAAYRHLLTFLDRLGLDPDPDTTMLYKELIRRRRLHPAKRARPSLSPSLSPGCN